MYLFQISVKISKVFGLTISNICNVSWFKLKVKKNKKKVVEKKKKVITFHHFQINST